MSSLNKQANELAKKYRYQVGKYLGEWNGYNVYVAGFNDGYKHYVGLPLYLLEKDGKWDSIQSYESLKILKHFQSYKKVGE